MLGVDGDLHLDSVGPECVAFWALPSYPLPDLSCGLATWSQGGAA